MPCGKSSYAMLFAVLLFYLITVPISPAYGQEADVPGDTAEEAYQLADVTVTAQKKKENVQQVPESVSVISSQDIEDANLTDSSEIHRLVPNLITSGTNNRGLNFPLFNIRGVGNLYEGDSAISFYIDDVPVSDPAFFSFALENIERIEVLRGPQGTLYGMNTEGGVINIVTRQAGNTLQGTASAQYGSYDRYRVSGALQGPLIKNHLSLGLSLMTEGTDGYVENKATGNDRNGYTTYQGSTNLQWTVSDLLSVQVNVAAEKNNDGDWVWVVKDRDAYNAAWDAGVDEYDVYENQEGYAENDSDRESIKVTYRFPWADLVSVTSRLARTDDVGGDLDCTTLDYMSFDQSYDKEQYAQELRLVSPEEKKELSWIFGIFYSTKVSDTDQVFHFGSDYPMPFHRATVAEKEDDTYAVFGQSTLRLLDERFGITAGLRYEHAERSIKRNRYYTINGVNYALDDPALGYLATNYSGKYDLEDDFDSLLPKFTLDYRFKPEVMLYATAARGYKAGGFSSISNDPEVAAFDSEYAWTYEAGLKSHMLDGRLMANLSGFYTDVEDYQDRIAVDNVVTMRNAAKAKIYGAEAEFRARPLRGLDVSASLGVLNAEYDDYTDTEDGQTVCFDNNSIAYVPEYQYNITAQYRFRSGIYLRGELYGIGKFYFTRANTERMSQDGYEIINAKIGYEADHFDIYLYANNLFDEYYYTQLSDASGYRVPGLYEVGFVGEPMTCGCMVKYRF